MDLNSVVTPGFIDPIEERDTIDVLVDSFTQLKRTMVAHYKPNKLKTQTEFNAVCLNQMNNTLIGNKLLIRVKARIPEMHNLLPIPKGIDDLDAMSLYPTFQASINDINPQPTNGSIVPGTKLVVSFDNLANFSQGTLKKIWDLHSARPTTTAQADLGESTTQLASAEHNSLNVPTSPGKKYGRQQKEALPLYEIPEGTA